MTKATFYYLLALGLILGFAIWAIPAVKRKLLSGSNQVTVKQLSVADMDFEDADGDLMPKTVVKLEIYFPMGSAPEVVKELSIVDDDGRTVEAIWSTPDREDLPDKGVTRWAINELILPRGFRQGQLRNKVRELVFIRLEKPGFVAQ